MELAEILIDIHGLENELLGFEKKYGVRSEIFYQAYQGGEEPENSEWVMDFSEWAGLYKTWLQRQAEYREEANKAKQKVGSLMKLIRQVA